MRLEKLLAGVSPEVAPLLERALAGRELVGRRRRRGCSTRGRRLSR